MQSKRSLSYGLLALSVSLGVAASPAVAGDDCEAPLARWQSRDAVLHLAERNGWTVQRLKIDDGCYEIRGKDGQGRSFKAKLDPETLAIVKMKLRDSGHDRSRLDGAYPAERPAQGDSAPAGRQPLFTPGSTPRGHVE